MAKKKTAAKATALAVRPKRAQKRPAAPVVTISDPQGLMVAQSPVGQLGELATVGALGLAELKLTEREESILSKAVEPSLVQFKPKKKDGPPEIPYLPHIVYTRWFNEAFGRTGWSIVPTALPKKVDNLILVPYLLYIHGIPVAAATGEQEYYESNKQQTYGDVIESTVASALRRCAKRLGVGLEMWDKAWLAVHAIPPHLRGQRRQESRQVAAPDSGVWDAEVVAEREAAGRPASAVEVITKEQWKRLGSIAEKMGRNQAEVNLWLKKTYGVKDLKTIDRKHYAEIVRVLESRSALPLPGDGEE